MSRRIWLSAVSATAVIGIVVAMAPTAGVASPPAASALGALEGAADHTLTLDLAGDTWVNNSGQSTSQQASPELRVGSNALGLVKARSYLEFDYAALASIPADAVVTGADLTLSNFVTGSCAGSPIRISRITGAWTVAGLKWGAQPAVTAIGSSTSTAAYGATACPAEGAVTFDATEIVKSWVGGSARRGIQIKADKEGANTGYRKYRSAENGDSAKAATLTVTYNSYPATAAELAFSPGYNGFVSSLTPTFSAKVVDPDGGEVGGFFEVRKGTTPTSPIVWTGLSEPVESGAVASITMPAGVLLDGSSYTVAAYGHDGELKSKSAVAKAFKVDVTAPEVTITSDVFTDGEWTNPTPASAHFTLDGSADVGGFYVVVDGQSLPAAAANSSGDYTITSTPTAGWHTLEVTPVDRAGNTGDPVTFSFGTGSPAFTLPTEWQGSTGDFPVSASAPAGALGASLQWRAWGQGEWQTATEITREESPWDGTVSTDGGRATTDLLTWHAGQEVPEGVARPALIQVRACFQYAEGQDACTAERFVALLEAE